MTRIEFFSYTDEQWNDIKTFVRKGLRLDADEIMICDEPRSVRFPLRDRIEIAAGDHIFLSLMEDGRPGYKQLTRLRSKAIALDDEVSNAFPLSFSDYDPVGDTHRVITRLVR